MRSFLLFLAVVALLSLTTGGFGANCPPNGPFPHPQIISAFVPDSSCLDTSGHNGTGGPDQQKACLVACELHYSTFCVFPDTGITFSWSVLGGTIVSGQGTNCVTVLWGPAGNGTISIAETTSAGCVGTEERCVKIIDSPIAAFTAPSSVCKNSAVNFSNQSINAVSYFWDFGDGGTSTLQNPTHAYSVAGTYTVTLVAYNKCGCSDSVTHTISVSNLQGVEIDCPATVCALAKECYSTPSGCPGAVYNWSVTGGTILGASNTSTICVQWGNGPQGTISLFITGCGNVCNDTTTVIVPIISPNGPISGPTVVCPGANNVYTLPLWPGTYYNWNVIGGTIISGWNSNQITVQWPTTPGTYSVSAVWNNILLGCGGYDSIVVNVRPEFLLFAPPGPFCLGSTTTFFANDNANWTVTGGTFTGNGTNSITVTWTSSGPQTVTANVINTSMYCNPTQTANVLVVSPPPAVSITGPLVICPGQSYSYTATTTGPNVSVQWSVVGGTIVGSSTANPVTVTWSGPGTLSVQQVMTTPPFCPSVPISINVNPLPIPTISGSSNVCMDQTFTYTAGLPNPNIVYTWSIVDGSGNPSPLGSVTSGQGTNQVNILWHGPGGTVFIKLMVCGTPVLLPITIGPKPVPTISMTGKVCDPGGGVVLTSSPASSYLWSNGANTQSILVGASGTYSVTVTNAAGCTGTASIVVPHTPGPVASISTPDPTFYCPVSPPPTINTTLYALQGPGYTYVWSPGGQTTSSITVTTPGSYSVTVTDANGCFATSNVITVSVGPCAGGGCTTTETINFTITPPICNPVSFNGTFSGGVGSIGWNFGDPASGANNTSNLVNPTHTFTSAGYYIVTFSGVDISNNCPVSKTQSVLIPIAADFSFVNNCGVVTFTDQSTYMPSAAINSWSWSFPGGTPASSNLQNPPSVTFAPGTHAVSLTVSNGTCTQTVTKNVIIANPPSAVFTLPATACVGTDIPMSGPGFPVVSWAWNFGDAATSAIQNTSHAWATPGTYTVTLTVTDTGGCTNTATQSITITSPPTGCTITPSGPLTFCQGGSVTLTASSGASYQWQLNNVNIPSATSQTYTATQTGTYTVIITDPSGCTCTPPSVNVVVNPLPLAIITPNQPPIICGSGLIQLTASAGTGYTYLWSPSGNTSQVEFANLNTPGAYPYSVTITDPNGCTNTAAIIINVYPVPPPPTITPSGPTVFCKGGSVTLTSSSPVNNLWNTGATTQSITVTQGGTYTVTVTAPNGCTSSASMLVNPMPLPDFSLFPFGCDSLCDTVKIPGPIGNYPGYYTYQWQYNGNNIPPPNGTNDTLTPIGSGQYSLILTGPAPTFCMDSSNVYNLTLHDCDSLCLGKICGRKWNDKNGNHKFNYGTETGIKNWKICLVKCNIDGYPTNDTLQCTYTDSLGFYCFTNLCPGDYCVVEEHKPGWAQTWPMNPPFYHVTITDSQWVNGLDFGNRRKCIDIWVTADTIGIPPNANELSPLTVYPAAIPYPVSISFREDPTQPWEQKFSGIITDNVIALPWWCKHGYYMIKRHHVTNYVPDRVYIDNILVPGGAVDSVEFELQDTTGGVSILFLNTYLADTTEKYRTFTAAQLAGGEQVKPVKRPKPKPGTVVPLPNTANVIDEFIRQGCIPTIGLAKRYNAGGKEKGYLVIIKQKDAFATLNTKGTVHTGSPHGLDFFINGKPVLKKQKSMPPTKHNNRLLANLLALKLNICASDMAKTPSGFGDLVYSPVSPYPSLDWMTDSPEETDIRTIADIADSMMTKWEGIPFSAFDSLNSVIELLNASFAGTLPFGPQDTATWVTGGKLKLNGAKALSDVPYLLKVAGLITPRVRPTINPDTEYPDFVTLDQNYPNPFNPTTTIEFELPEQGFVTLKIYNVLGQEVARLIDHEMMEDGSQMVEFNANDFTSGVYFYRLTVESIGDQAEGTLGQTYTSMKKMLLIK